jgi:hypothetical protein
MKEYKGFTLQQVCHRKGALDILLNPSRMSNTLFYPNGKVEYAPISK